MLKFKIPMDTDTIFDFFSLVLSKLSAYFGSLDFSRIIDILQYNPQEPLLFSSGAFLFIFAGFMLVYFLLRKQFSSRLLFVTLFSYYFFYKSSGFYFALLALVTISDYLIARVIPRSNKAKL